MKYMENATPHVLKQDPGFQRINEVLREYWESVRGSKPYPDESDVDITQLATVWDSCLMVRFIERTQRYEYSYLGSDLVTAYGDDSQEKEICEKLVYPSSNTLFHQFEEVVANGQPIEQEGEFVNSNQLHVRYRSILLPVGVDGESRVGFIIGGMRWKPYL